MKLKIALIGILSIVLCLVLTGCGTEPAEKSQEVEDIKIEALGDDDLEDEDIEDEEEAEYESSVTKLYEDDSKIVYQDGEAIMEFTFNGEEITGYKVYTEFDTAEDAQLALDDYNEDPDEDISRAYVEGNKLYFEYDESVYGELTASEVKFMYSILEVTDGE